MAYCEECGELIKSKNQRCWETGATCYSNNTSAAREPSKSYTYKGRKYKLLYLGNTKYGRRAHLQFWDGSKDFWINV